MTEIGILIAGACILLVICYVIYLATRLVVRDDSGKAREIVGRDLPNLARTRPELERTFFNEQEPEDWATLLERDDWVVIDVETCGFGKRAEVIEMAIINAAGKCIFNQRFDPLSSIARDATAVHGITKRMLKGKPSWPEALPALRALAESISYAVFYNAEFDNDALDTTCDIWGCDYLFLPSLCAMEAYAAHHQRNHRGNGKWKKLSLACRKEGIILENEHSALGDANATRELVKILGARQER